MLNMWLPPKCYPGTLGQCPGRAEPHLTSGNQEETAAVGGCINHPWPLHRGPPGSAPHGGGASAVESFRDPREVHLGAGQGHQNKALGGSLQPGCHP